MVPRGASWRVAADGAAMSGIRPFERSVARFYGLALTRRQRRSDKAFRAARRWRDAERARTAFHSRHAKIAAAPAKLSRWKRFVNWLAEWYVNLFLGRNAC